MPQTRLDILLCDRGLAKSRTQAQSLILSGAVWTGQERLDKCGQQVPNEISLNIKELSSPFVSRGGEKLAKALEIFEVPLAGRVCLDVGSSTGGFTDCLLQKGARRVFAVDVGYGQLDYSLRKDPRVTVMERVNARYLTQSQLQQSHRDAEKLSLGTMDVSFISAKKILAPLRKELPQLREWVILFKPQFELGREHIGKGGLVRSPEAVKEALESFRVFMEDLGLREAHPAESSPLLGKKSGNVEYLLHYVDNSK